MKKDQRIIEMRAVIENVNELEWSVFPSLHHGKEGWPSD